MRVFVILLLLLACMGVSCTMIYTTIEETMYMVGRNDDGDYFMTAFSLTVSSVMFIFILSIRKVNSFKLKKSKRVV
jgi:hypothetical protein